MKSYARQFYLCFLNFCEVWNLFSRAPAINCLWCYYRSLIWSIALENVKKNEVWLKICWYKDFVHWKLKLLSFLMDSVLNRWYLIAKLNSFENRQDPFIIWDVDTSTENSLRLSIKLRAVIYFSHFTPFYYFYYLTVFRQGFGKKPVLMQGLDSVRIWPKDILVFLPQTGFYLGWVLINLV